MFTQGFTAFGAVSKLLGTAQALEVKRSSRVF